MSLTKQEIDTLAQATMAASTIAKRRTQIPMALTNMPTVAGRTQADPISANSVLAMLKHAGLPMAWYQKFAEAIKSATNGADNPAFSDWSMVRELLTMTMPRSAQQMVAINCCMEFVQSIKDPEKAIETTHVLANVLGGNDELDVVARGAKAYSLEQLAEKFGQALPKLNALIEEATFGETKHVLAVKELPDGTIVAELVAKPK